MKKVLVKKVFVTFMVITMLLGYTTFSPLESNAEDAAPLENLTLINPQTTTETLFSAAYGNGCYVVVGNGGTIMTSTDGRAWKIQTPQKKSLYSVTYGDSKFVAVGANTIMTSVDGMKWQEQVSDTGIDLLGVTYGKGKFVAVGRLGKILTSVDGAVWTDQYYSMEEDLQGVIYGNDRLFNA